METKILFLTILSAFALIAAGCAEQQTIQKMPHMAMEGVAENQHFSETLPMDAHGLAQAAAQEAVELSDGAVYDLDAREVKNTLAGREVKQYAYNGQFPGPLLEVRQGSSVWINFTNNLDMDTTVHWHGLRLENQYDGVPDVTQEPVKPGESFLYKLDFPDEGLYWYHPHVREDLQQELGLYGGILVEPEQEGYYNDVDTEEVLLLDDIALSEEGIVSFYEDLVTHALMGRFGNVMLVNGEESYERTVTQGDAVRFFFANVANARTFNVGFEGLEMRLVGSDSGRYERESMVDSVTLGVSERAIVEVIFDKPGVYELLHTTPEKSYVLGAITVLADDAAAAVSGSGLSSSEELTLAREKYEGYLDVEPDFDFLLTVDMAQMGDELHMEMMGHMMGASIRKGDIEWEDDMAEMNALSTDENLRWVIQDVESGKRNMDIEPEAKVGEVKKIRITNALKSMHPMQHPIHLHGQRFLVLSQDGKPNDNLAWKDTVLIPVGEEVELLVEFTNPGEWMLHCHIAEHLHAGMMTSFTVT